MSAQRTIPDPEPRAPTFVPAPWSPALTPEEQDDLFMLSVLDDTEDAPWMTMGDLQFWSASSFAHSLHNYALAYKPDWYVASMLPITYRWPLKTRRGPKKQVSPDTMVALVKDHARTSYDLQTEGGPPVFVLEVVSPSSTYRDRVEKVQLYRILKVPEYALFTPSEEGSGQESTLEGYRRGPSGRYRRWKPERDGRLWSQELELYLVVRGALVQAETRDGQPLLTPQQSETARQHEAAARQAAEAAQQQAEAARQAAECAQQQAEADVERLRAEFERYRREHDGLS